MNIAIVCYSTFGGSGVVATELGVALAQKGYQIHFITYGQPVRLSAFHKNIHLHQVYVEEYPLFRYQPYELALSSKMVEVVREYNIDVIHAHYAIPHAYTAYMAKQILQKEGWDRYNSCRQSPLLQNSGQFQYQCLRCCNCCL